MLKNQWYVILESKELKKKPVGIVRLNKQIVLYRDENGKVVCLNDVCKHRGAALSKGSLKNGCLTCPFHAFKYDSTGKCVEIPANGKNTKVSKRFNTESFPTREIDGFIFMFNGKEEDITSEPKYFNELLEGYSYSSFHKHWNTHYSRAIENQLDVIHVPFVHKATIGRGNKTLVNGPVVKWDEDKMTFYVFNEVDKGQKPLKASEIMDYESLFSLQFIIPNIWQNRISPDVRVTAAFVPVDEENTIVYIRFYQKFMKLPILKSVVNQGACIFNRKVLAEDYAVVKTQLPIKSDISTKEQLVQGDLPIGEYRRIVASLVQEE